MRKIVDEKDLKMRECSVENLDDIYNIQTIMLDTFREEEKNFFIPDTKEYFNEILDNPNDYGWIYGLYLDDKMIGWIYLSVSKRVDELVSNIPNRKGKYADIDGVIVIPEYRGNHLQNYMMKYVEDKAKEKHIDNIVGEISFENTYSYQNFKELGYEIVAQYKKQGTINRNILAKKMK